MNPDWYALLGLPATATTDELAVAVERLSRQATALSVTSPERSRLLRDQVRAIKADLLSGQDQRDRYDQDRASRAAIRPDPAPPPSPPAADYPPQPQPQPRAQPPCSPAPHSPAPHSPAPHSPAPYNPAHYKAPLNPAPHHLATGGPAAQAPAAGPRGPAPAGSQAGAPGFISRVARFLQTGWTCTACGHGALPGDKFCQKCGAAIQIPSGAQQARSPASPAMQTAFCGKCGARIAPGNTFCTQCGAQRS